MEALDKGLLYEEGGAKGVSDLVYTDFVHQPINVTSTPYISEHLGWSDGYHVLGQSWGGMLAMEHALEHAPGMEQTCHAAVPRRSGHASGVRWHTAA